ncbi:MAG TPA: trypsin-like peptidase domain-containing protein [Candidatus Angelobacter sp.]|nr:trypsin-like peptidase domain-containing protein [Candidatus Angelobacter sp.]
MFCRFCGATLPDDSTFCNSCGKPLAAPAPTGSSSGAATAPAIVAAPTTITKKTTNSRILLASGLVAAVVVVGILIFLQLRPTPTTLDLKPDRQTVPAKDLKATPVQPAVLTTEELFKQAAPSVVLIQVFNGSGVQLGTGSGFVGADGMVVTNYHVIRGAYTASARLQDGSTNPIQGVTGFDPNRDVAVLKVDNLTAKPLPLADSDRVQIGDKVVAIGSPVAIQNTISDGIISGLRRGALQTSTPISPGSSGGPLFNMQGEVVGITVANIVEAQNLNFAVPINWAKNYLRSSGLTTLRDLAEQNMVAQEIVGSTISVPAHQRRAFNVFVDRNRMADPELEGTFSSTGGFGGQIRVYVTTANNVVYDSGRTTSGTLHLPLAQGAYQVVIDNTESAMFPRSVSADLKFHYIK